MKSLREAQENLSVIADLWPDIDLFTGMAAFVYEISPSLVSAEQRHEIKQACHASRFGCRHALNYGLSSKKIISKLK